MSSQGSGPCGRGVDLAFAVAVDFKFRISNFKLAGGGSLRAGRLISNFGFQISNLLGSGPCGRGGVGSNQWSVISGFGPLRAGRLISNFGFQISNLLKSGPCGRGLLILNSDLKFQMEGGRKGTAGGR